MYIRTSKVSINILAELNLWGFVPFSHKPSKTQESREADDSTGLVYFLATTKLKHLHL